jgi:hypothetical protein
MNGGIVTIKDSLAQAYDGAFVGSIENTYTEVLQDTERVSMILEVYFKDDPSQRTHVTANRSDVMETSYVKDVFLTLEPGRPLHILKQWSHKTDAGDWYWTYRPHQVKSLPSGEIYYETSPLTLVAEATIQGYKRVPAQHVGPYEFSVSYRFYLPLGASPAAYVGKHQ